MDKEERFFIMGSIDLYLEEQKTLQKKAEREKKRKKH